MFSPAKKVSIDLKKYTNAGTYTVPVSVELPDGCSLVNNVSVEIILEKQNRMIRHKMKIAAVKVRRKKMRKTDTIR